MIYKFENSNAILKTNYLSLKLFIYDLIQYKKQIGGLDKVDYLLWTQVLFYVDNYKKIINEIERQGKDGRQF